MKKLINAVKNGVVNFSRDEEGAQIVEYSLIIAVVSIGLILLMQNGSLFTGFTKWMDRVKDCLSGAAGACV
jgi:pilus assembly protein Flp/PilA